MTAQPRPSDETRLGLLLWGKTRWRACDCVSVIDNVFSCSWRTERLSWVEDDHDEHAGSPCFRIDVELEIRRSQLLG